MRRRILVLGFGNDLVGDDGAGPAVIAELVRRGLPAGLRAEAGGADSLRLLSRWRGEPVVFLVDALQGRERPGSIHRLSHSELLSLPQRHATAHRLSLPESLRWFVLANPEMAFVRYRLWGIEPASLGLGAALSPQVTAAVGQVADEILRAASIPYPASAAHRTEMPVTKSIA